MVKVIIDGIEVDVPAGASVLQAAELAGKEIPRFCYHDKLSVAGNCRMCLVEIEKSPKPQASCALPVSEGMVVHTDSPLVRQARRGVMEFLLINHPLDCPICDQGGECDLQDQAFGYGLDHSRYREPKRAVKDKELGPLIKTVMTRCILCTRCVRFAAEIAGVPEVGALGRGEDMEITAAIEKSLSSELSGNLIDVCPVGALTAKPYAFVARPWELNKTDGIDVFDALGSNIRIDSRGGEVLRVLPRLNDDVNEEWISDKSRFAIDGLKHRRLDRPWIRKEGKLVPASWREAFDAIARRLSGVRGSRIGAMAGDLVDAESLVALKDLMTRLGAEHLECRQDGARLDPTARPFYLFNSTIAGIEEADAILIVGSDPRREAPVLNARIRKQWFNRHVPVALIGPERDLTYRYEWLGAEPARLNDLLAGNSPFAETLAKAAKPLIIVGQPALRRADGFAILATAWALAARLGALRPEWCGFNVLHTAAGRVAALDLGFHPRDFTRTIDDLLAEELDVLWLLGADEAPLDKIRPGTFVIYQGHHGDRGAQRADVILPGAAYTEKHGTYVNTEGRVQQAENAVFPPGEAREDWRIIRAFAERIGERLPYDDLDGIRRRLAEVNPVFAMPDRVDFPRSFDRAPHGEVGAIAPGAVEVPRAFYQTDVISRASRTMAECRALFEA
jgi:NADH-quinone oxidoreductase subunit G